MKNIGLINNQIRSDFFVLGVFFLLWSVNSYYLGGNTLKIFTLLVGFTFIICTTLTLKINKLALNFIIKSIITLIIYWFFAYFRFQDTLRPLLIFFDIICVLLLNSGYLISQNLKSFRQVRPTIILIICLMTFIGTYMFLKNQTDISLVHENNLRIGGQAKEENINSVGVAYVNANIFFLIFSFFSYKKLKNWIKVFMGLSILFNIITIISTGSRGALLFTSLILLTHFIFKSKKNLILVFFKLIVYLIAIVVFYNILSDFFPIIEQKIDSSFERFISLFEFYSNGEDRSLGERADVYDTFFESYHKNLFLGEKGYIGYPHNVFIEIVNRWGIFFGFPLLFILITSVLRGFRLFIRKSKIEAIYQFLLLGFLFSFLQSLSSMSLEMNRILWLSLGFIVGYRKKIQSNYISHEI